MTFVKNATELFSEYRDPEQAEGMKKYMKDHFDFLGINRPSRDLIQKELIASIKITEVKELEHIIKELWKLPFREYQYLALDILFRYRKIIPELQIAFFEKLVENKSWWDTVDAISTKGIGAFYLVHSKQYKKELLPWAESDNMWKRRACIIFQLNYKDMTDTIWLKNRILENSDSREFFLQKAIGWALRQYSKTDPAWVIAFTEKHLLMPLSRREALRLL